jgi:hypothetical protein
MLDAAAYSGSGGGSSFCSVASVVESEKVKKQVSPHLKE